MTPSAAAGTRGAPGGRCWGPGGAGVHQSVRGELQGVPAPSGTLTGYNPPSRHPARLVKTQTSAPLVWLPPGTGRSPQRSALPRFGYLLRGCFRTAWTGQGDNGAAPAPNPALSGLRKIPVFLPREPLCWGGWGCKHSSSDALPAGEGAAEPPWVPPGREQDSASGAPAGNWLVSTWKKKKYCYFLSVEARNTSVCPASPPSSREPFQPGAHFSQILFPHISPLLLPCNAGSSVPVADDFVRLSWCCSIRRARGGSSFVPSLGHPVLHPGGSVGLERGQLPPHPCPWPGCV